MNEIPKNTTPSRETYIVELCTNTPLGKDEQGSQKLKRYLEEGAEIFGIPKIADPATHLSEKYGFSGWLPGESASAMHAYAWDERKPSFVSVDVVTRPANNLAQAEKLPKFREHAKDYFQATDSQIVFKTSRDSSEWRDLAPEIIRQRLTLRIKLRELLTAEALSEYFDNLCLKLDMLKISNPLIRAGKQTTNAWMHWETSGVVLTQDKQNLEGEIDIYTCKSFSPAEARRFTRESLGEVVEAREF